MIFVCAMLFLLAILFARYAERYTDRCPHCGGSKKRIISPCPRCKGEGREVKDTITITPCGLCNGARELLVDCVAYKPKAEKETP